MDIDGDGNDDIISGSYAPGHLYIFRGLGDAQFAPGEIMKDAEGRDLRPANPTSSEQYDSQGLASVPFAFDHDNDGDFDLICGNIAGEVIVIANEGSKTEAKFGSARTKITAGGSPIKLHSDSGPVVADWDADGLPDLIVGSGDGAVVYYRNTGTLSQPAYAAGEELISAVDFTAMQSESGEPARPGMRAKVCATDYNGDGRLDLLVGDMSYQQVPPPDLSAQDIAKRDELQKQQQEIMPKLQETAEKIMSANEGLDPNTINWNDHPEYMAIVEEYSRISSELQQYTGGMEYHGWVWLYLRKADA